MIFYLEENRIFVLETENTHYVFGIDPAGYNRHLHWGAKCDPADYAFTEIGDENSNHSMLDEYRQELTPFGSTVYRTCDLKAQFADGCREVALRYTGYRLEDDTLRVAFADTYYPLQVRLGYRVYPGLDIINLGTGVGYSVLDMVKAFSKACGKEIPYEIKPRREGDIAMCYADPSKAAKVLGWKAERGLEQMCEDAWRWQSQNPDGYRG